MTFFRSVVLLLALLSLTCGQHNFGRKDGLIKIKNGLLQGGKISHDLYAFRGIPYAKPPLKKLRFEPPQEADNWEGIWNATYDRSDCIQIGIDSPYSLVYSSRTQGDEDCLYINVYTPQLPKPNAILPVMVWIYGGAFIFGTSNYSTYAPDDLVKQGVIVVTFNYRLGIFGFLSTNDHAAPGNAGLKDQILALKWVQNNIKAFGGDPTKVTIFGQSAGSASVSYLVLSPLTKGLFKSAIMQSGTAMCLWSLSRTAREAAFRVGRSLRIATGKTESLVNSLKEIPADLLLKKSQVAMALILTRNPLNGLVYAPVIEIPSGNAVLTKSSYERLSKGNFNRVPTIIGYNSAEAAGFANILSVLQVYLLSYDLKPSRLIPINMKVSKYVAKRVGHLIRDHYAGEEGRLSYPDDNFTFYTSDHQFVRPIQKTAELMSNFADVYLYKFAYTTNRNSPGAGHADELDFIFQSDRNTAADIRIRKCMIQLWTNFAKYNNPTPLGNICSGNLLWKPMTPIDRKAKYYINIDSKITSGIDPNKIDIDFWEELYQIYGNSPFDTY